MTAFRAVLLLAILNVLSYQKCAAFVPSKVSPTRGIASRPQANLNVNEYVPMRVPLKNRATQLYASGILDEQMQETTSQSSELSPIKAALTKAGLMTFVVSMCVALPITLAPPALLYKANILSRTRKEKVSLRIGQFCTRWLMRLIPFAKVEVLNDDRDVSPNPPEPSIWVCNHSSMLDLFVLLATDKKMRGKDKRPIKIIYWKDLEKNPINKIFFRMCGFFPVEMEDNGSGNANQYKRSSFKALLKGIRQAFEDGFDIGILPEGQINPSPETGLQPVFPGAFSLARMSKRPIRMMGMHGLNHLWNIDGMNVTGRNIKVRAYPYNLCAKSGDEFVESFNKVVGTFGASGEDRADWQAWLNGDAWKEMAANKKKLEEEKESKKIEIAEEPPKQTTA